MSDVDDNERSDGDADAGAAAKPKVAGKKLVLFVVLPLILLLALGGAGAAFLLTADAVEETAEAEQQKPQRNMVFYDLPEMLVNLSGGGKKTHYLKIRVALELESEDSVPVVEAVMPRIIDNFQVYLRELRIDDLNGSAGLLRLKEELLVRINTAASTAGIKDVLFKEMLVQ